MVRYNWFYDHLHKSQSETDEQMEQYTRGFLIYLLGTTLFANRWNTMGLYLLSALVVLPRVRYYDWGGAGLATLYGYMSSSSYKKGNMSREMRLQRLCLTRGCMTTGVILTAAVSPPLPTTAASSIQ
ncbi:hypothetical protein ACSBR1_008473 [Camellia fascicularis]